MEQMAFGVVLYPCSFTHKQIHRETEYRYAPRLRHGFIHNDDLGVLWIEMMMYTQDD